MHLHVLIRAVCPARACALLLPLLCVLPFVILTARSTKPGHGVFLVNLTLPLPGPGHTEIETPLSPQSLELCPVAAFLKVFIGR